MNVTIRFFLSLALFISSGVTAAAELAKSCYGTPYASVKNGAIQKGVYTETLNAVLTKEKASSKPVTPDSRIQIQAQRLASPVEIARIVNGATFQWVGGFINDGLSSFTGIDVDRMELISISRRIIDKRLPQFSNRAELSDPVFPDYDNTSIVRKWTDGIRTEMEVVTRTALRPNQIEAFICLANAAWASPPLDYAVWTRPRMSDTLVDEKQIKASEDEQARTVFSRTDYRNEPIEALISRWVDMRYKW